MDRRIINVYYSERPIRLISALNNLLWDNPINLVSQQPVVLSDSITVVQGYESNPHDSGTSVAYRLSEDGNEILVFNPEMDPSLYDVEMWTISELPDDRSTARLPFDDLLFIRICDYLIGGQGGTKEEMLSNIAESV